MKKLMRKILSFVLVCGCVFSVSACDNENETSSLGAENPPVSCAHSYQRTIMKEATCGTNGIMYVACRLCGDSYVEEITKTNNHTFSGTITKEASCKETGEKTHTCIICGDSYIENIKKTDDHNYKSTVIKEATDSISGTKKYTCSICEDSYEQPFLLSKVTYLDFPTKAFLTNGSGKRDGYLACTLDSVTINQNNEITHACVKLESYTNITNFYRDCFFGIGIKNIASGKVVWKIDFVLPSKISSGETIYYTITYKNPLSLSEGDSYEAYAYTIDYPYEA